MSVQQSYNLWASQYDDNENKTRDLEARVLRETLATIGFNKCLEIGCGTGKNTIWLAQKANKVLAIDLSEEMLAKAKEKIPSPTVEFQQADIMMPWAFTQDVFDLVVFSLVLEHIEQLNPVLKNASTKLTPNGYVYIAELHPFKQYSGSKARFDTADGQHVVDCFVHHVSDFMHAAMNAGLMLVMLDEYFDHDDRKQPPRILRMLFKKME